MDIALIIFILSNIGIFLGYAFVARYVFPSLNIHLMRTKLGGVLFFAFCAGTHFELAYHAILDEPIDRAEMTSFHMLLIHAFQVAAVWAFTTGLYKEIGRSDGKLELDRNEALLEQLATELTVMKRKYSDSQDKNLDRVLDKMKELGHDVE